MPIIHRILSLLTLLLLTSAAAAQGYYTRYHADAHQRRIAHEWLRSGHWRNGFDKASPHATVNEVDFYQQYQKHPDLWKALFEWLQVTDLLSMPAGKVTIPGTQLVASIEDGENQPLDQRRSESHYHHIDFQYVVKGSERFGLIDHYTSRANTAYRPDVIHYAYDVSRARFYDSTPGRFFLFFPGDWHIAKISTDGPDQQIRVVVVKMPYGD